MDSTMSEKINFSHLTKRLVKKITLLSLMIFSFSNPSFAEDSAQINLRDVEIPTLIETVSRITGKSFVIDPRVKGRVTVVTSSDITKDELYDTFLSILQVHGFSAVPSGSGIIKVVPSNQAKQQPVPVVGEEDNYTGDNKNQAIKPIKKTRKPVKYSQGVENLLNAYSAKYGSSQPRKNNTIVKRPLHESAKIPQKWDNSILPNRFTKWLGKISNSKVLPMILL